MKQSHAEQRQAEDHKFHGSPKMPPAPKTAPLRDATGGSLLPVTP
jgi:hypothetical protein